MFLFLKAALQCAFNRVGIRRASAPCTPMASHNHWGGHVDVLRLAPWPNTGFHCPTARIIKLNTMWYLLASAGVETVSPVLLRVVFIKINMLLFASVLFFLLLQSRGICSPAL
ncbi:hypothetical protein PC123_g26062 [Phytophthora cactorum]|nr:hypothetical protein PC123_g26062 [Phytophthora cactorum]